MLPDCFAVSADALFGVNGRDTLVAPETLSRRPEILSLRPADEIRTQNVPDRVLLRIHNGYDFAAAILTAAEMLFMSHVGLLP